MKLGIINSAFYQAGVDTVSGLKHIARIGFDCVDIATEAVGISKKEIGRVARATEKLGLPVVSLPFTASGLTDFQKPVREFHIERSMQFLDLARNWGANNILLVLGEYIWEQEIIPPKAQWNWGLESCRRLGDYADKRGLDIALELEPFRLSLLNSVDTMLRFVNECRHPRVRANIDISHLALAHIKATELKRLKGKAIHVHLSDCDGKVHGDLPPGRGVVKFRPYLQAIKELKIDGAVSVELEYAPNPKRVVAWVEEAYRGTARLLADVGLRG